MPALIDAYQRSDQTSVSTYCPPGLLEEVGGSSTLRQAVLLAVLMGIEL